MKRPAVLTVLAVLAACKSSSSSTPQDDACAGPCPSSAIKHVVIVIQENHTFDDHFGGYCTAPAGSSPSCNDGPACCEAMPATNPAGTSPAVIDDGTMGNYDPPHDAACEAAEMDDGKMDAYATAPSQAGNACGDPRNVARVDPAVIQPMWDLVSGGALADRYFQPVVGQSYANDMYFARAQFAFEDDTVAPLGAVGVSCGLESTQQDLGGTTIGDLLIAGGRPVVVLRRAATRRCRRPTAACPPKPDDCPFIFPFDPCGFEPSDVPFEYYPSTRDRPDVMKDLADLDAALDQGGLPAVAFVKASATSPSTPGSTCSSARASRS